jgi:sec-independent protein translocase protein TatA
MLHPTLYPVAIGMPGVTEWIIIGAIGLLIFGKRLPEVGRSLGKGIVEFKKGLKGIDEELEQVDRRIDTPPQRPAISNNPTGAGHKFDPETGKPYKFDPQTGQPIQREEEATTSTHD